MCVVEPASAVAGLVLATQAERAHRLSSALPPDAGASTCPWSPRMLPLVRRWTPASIERMGQLAASSAQQG